MGIQGNERVDVLAKLALNEATYAMLSCISGKTGNFSGINKFRANFMQYILNWVCGLTHSRSVEETNSFFVASVSDIHT